MRVETDPGGDAPRPAARLVGEGVVVVALLAWWWAARGLPEFVLPGPVAVGSRLVELFTRPEFLGHTLVSTARVVASVAIAVVLGSLLAIAAASIPWIEPIVHDRIKPVLNSFPSIGWAILAAIWFDAGSVAVIFVQVAILVPFCLVNVAQGLSAIDRELLEMGRSFGRSRWRSFRLVTLPLLLPYLLAARADLLRHRLEDRAGLGTARRSQRTGLPDAARTNHRGQRDVSRRLLRDRDHLRSRRAAADRPSRATLRRPLNQGPRP